MIERFGYEDEKLSMHLHEKMLHWLENKKNCVQMLEKLGCIEIVISIKHNSSFIYCDFYEGKCTGGCYPKESRAQGVNDVMNTWNEMISHIESYYKNDIKIVRKKILDNIEIEPEIEAENKEFIEAKISFKEHSKRFEIPNLHKDCFIDFNTINFKKKQPFYVKIKSKTNQIGELIRQTNLIRSSLKRGTWILLTTQKGLKKRLDSEGILVYKLKEKTKNN
ncbi:MAG: hypothetical protein EAX96_10715 [Candidatus Lokiarchaeota archaeon]|nr:hypothetical protein [Candidatus Lokiarchaeota archaeon]